jgi:SAM-dependent methyltransferase
VIAQVRPHPKHVTYLMGHSTAETERLVRQAELLNSTTRRLLMESGLTCGMSVLDLGSGAGDVAMIAAELVGPEGRVVGVDRNADVLAIARERAVEAGVHNVSFVDADLTSFEPTCKLEAIVGRLVLMYQRDPIELLQRLTRHLAPGGIAAFQEFNLGSSSLQCYPSMPLWQAFRGWVLAAVAHSGTEPLMGYKLAGVFSAVGLPTSHVWLESPLVAGPDLTWYSYMADSLRSILPLAIAAGAATAEEVDIDTLGDRLRAETLAVGGVAKAPDLVSTWARKQSQW